MPKFECLVVLQLLQKSNNKVTSRYHNYINFTLEAIHNYFKGGQYVVHFTTESDDFAYIADDFKISLADVVPYHAINNEQKELIVYQVTSHNVGNVMKSIRGVVRDNGLIGYSLKVNPMEN